MKKNIKYLIMDVDGTLTDGKIYMGSNGEVFKAFNIKDGYGIANILIHAGITPVIVTGRESSIVLKRADELKIKEVYQGVTDKADKIRQITDDLGCVAVIGDDINDISAMKAVRQAGGLAGCPADASQRVKEIVDYVCHARGGDGAVREFIEWILGPEEVCLL